MERDKVASGLANCASDGHHKRHLVPGKTVQKATPPEPTAFRTVDAAAMAAMDKVMQESNRRNLEYGGFIYQNKDGTYSYTTAVPGEPNNIKMGNFNKPPGEQQPVAIYHTHPGFHYNVTWFSTDDYLVSSFNHLPIYLGNMSGVVKVWSDVSGERKVR